ncbi:hypothetical protein NPJ82_10480 [Sphingomonas sp. NY01]|uniref:glycosyltransferase n=1 Tax=Sphingomonas sp. NY01 TaxID=2968057 RepID=UPI00315D0C03
MIFASVGSMLPFDRFVEAVDGWAAAHPATPVTIQIGDGTYEPRHADWVRIVPHPRYMALLERCSLFVAHVGIGSIVQALETGRPMVMLPRLASLGEHTTDHQLHTATRFRDTAGLTIVDDVAALHAAIDHHLAHPAAPAAAISTAAPPAMTQRIGAFLHGLPAAS